MSIFLGAAIAVLATGRLRAGIDPRRDALMDAFLWMAAGDTPVYRKDIRPGVPTAAMPPGRLTGFSRVIGPFTYLPKSAADLTAPERAAVTADPRFAPFAGIRARPRRLPSVLDISPEQMLVGADIRVMLLADPR